MDFSDYQGREILAWMTYNENYAYENTKCYISPRCFFDNGEPIRSDDFPDNGAILANFKNTEVSEFFRHSNEPVLIKMRKDLDESRCKNTHYEPGRGKSKYFISFDPYWHGDSYFTCSEFEGKDFYQIIDTNQDSYIRRELPKHILLYARQVLLRVDNNLYGPYECTGDRKLAGVEKFQYIVGEYDTREYNDQMYIVEENTNCVFLKQDALPSPFECAHHEDAIDKKTLLAQFKATLSSEKKYSRSELRRIVDDMSQYIPNNENGIDSATQAKRNKRIQEWILKMAKEDDSDRASIEDLLLRVFQYANEDDQFRDILHEQIRHLPQRQATDEADPIGRDIQQYEEIITDLQNQLEASKAECSDLTAAVNQNTPQSELEEIRHEIDKLNKEIAEKKVQADEWKQKEKEEHDAYDRRVQDNKQVEETFNKTITEFESKAEAALAAKVLDKELMNKLLRSIGEEPLDNTAQNLCLPVIQYLETPKTQKEKQDEIIATVQDYLQNAHREAEWNDVANYLICITQGFITTFAGEPGTGKTSLCTLLAKALGLAGTESSSSRFVDISVERGWTSVKDFIGYYNPLSKRTIASNERVLHAFEQMNYECRKKPNVIAPYLLLLDEANLSPIEHYWAPFFKSCDFDSAANRSISLGGKTIYQLPEHLRFLATVNFDHSTEELSPRFLDRSWVITLNPDDIDASYSKTPPNADHAISFSDLTSAFASDNESQENAQIWTKWEDVKRIFKGFNLPIMPRSQRMVTQYLRVAEQCMKTATARTSLAPIDYAIAQKILPTINGYGESYKNLIEELRKQVAINENSMPLTYNHLERMKKAADENMDFYQFFAK